MSPKLEEGSPVITGQPILSRNDPLSLLVLPERPPLEQIPGNIGDLSDSESLRIQTQRPNSFQETIQYFTEEDLLRVGDLPGDILRSDVLGTFPALPPDQTPGETTDRPLTNSLQVQNINQSLFMLRQFVSLTSAWPSNSQQAFAASLTYDPGNNRFRLEYSQNSRQSSLAGSSSSQFGVFAELSNSGTSVGVIFPLDGQPESTGRLGLFRQHLTSFLDFYKETFERLSSEEQQQLRQTALAILDSCVQDLDALASRTQNDQQREFALALTEQMRETRNQIDSVR